MEENQEDIWGCPECGQELDLTNVGFYTEIVCPNCGHKEIVHTKLANYDLTGVLGVGGMSVVLKAVDPVLKRQVAIKVLNDAYRNQPERIARFERECALMAKVRHENVVGVYSAGWARGQFYIAMELVEGRDLEYVVSNFGPIRQTEVLSMARQVALGLRAANRAGLLHRDMKPGNILVTPSGKAKVLDFGLSLTHRDEDTEQVIWATPYYVAPETIFREAEDVRTDIYALGMTMRYLLTGEDAFSDKPPAGIAVLAEYKRRLPSLRVGHLYLADSLCDLVDHMTEFDPQARPLSYDALLREIDDVMTDLRMGDTLDTPEGKRRFFRRLLLGAAATLGAGAVAAAVTSILSTPPPEQILVEPEPELDWPLYSMASGKVKMLMKQGCTDQVLHEYEWMARHNSTEPRFKAWAGLQAMGVAVLLGDEAKTAELGSLLTHWLDDMPTEDADVSHMSLAFKQVNWVVKRHVDAMRDYVQKSSNPTVVLLCVAGHRYHKEKGDAKTAGEFLSLARDAAKRCGADAAKLSEAVERWAASESRAAAKPPVKKPDSDNRDDSGKQADSGEQADSGKASGSAPSAPSAEKPSGSPKSAGEGAPSAVERLAALRRGCDAPRMAHVLNEILSDRSLRLSTAERDQYVLMKDVCDVLCEAYAAIDKAHAGAIAPDTMTPEQIRDAVAALKLPGSLSNEVYTMLLLLQGKLNEAERANPYASDTNSQNPFAILMRDWMFRARRG